MDDLVIYPPQAIDEIERLTEDLASLRFTYEQLGVNYNKLSIEYEDFKKSTSENSRDQFTKNWQLKEEVDKLKKKILDNTIRHAEEIMMLKGEIDALNHKVFEADYGVPF